MARSLQHDRLMRVSHSHVAATARDASHEQQIVALRLVQHPGSYTEWENQHSQLMQQICRPTHFRAQLVRMRAATLRLIHRRAVFEYLRDSRITGAKRHRYIAIFYGPRDYASSLIIEHGHYTRSWASASCSRFIGSEVLHDPAFESPMLEYEQWYGEYFRMFCDMQLATAAEESANCDRTLLPFLKNRAAQARERLVRSS
ncbi:MAG: hypothetical protein WDM77_06765 [Steroidobacteraceae bacterium]